MKQKPIVYVIVGPTASGKTGVGFELCKKTDGEIISADSMQIYRKLDIGTAKDKTLDVKQYLIDIKDVNENYSVSEFVKDANIAIKEILKKGKTPIVIGGTGLYINALVNQMKFNEELETDSVDEKLNKIELEIGEENLYDFLMSVDITAAKKIERNNIKRVKRAIKMYLSGNVKSEVEKKQDLWNLNGESKYQYYIIKLYLPREELYNRINKRVDIMVSLGIEKEAKYLKDMNLPKDLTAIKAIGYKEFFDYFDKVKTFEECVKDLKKNTRNYAKRQETWFNKLRKDIVLDGRLKVKEQVERILAKKEELEELYEKKD